VAHPHGLLGWLAGHERVRSGNDAHGRSAVLAATCLGNRAAEGGCHRLKSVANSQDRNAQVENAGIEHRSFRLVDTRRAATEHNGRGRLGGNFGGRDRVRHNLGVDPGLTHAARNQLGVLRPKVNNENGAWIRNARIGHAWFGHAVTLVGVTGAAGGWAKKARTRRV
jgi:hypothetical protein